MSSNVVFYDSMGWDSEPPPEEIEVVEEHKNPPVPLPNRKGNRREPSDSFDILSTITYLLLIVLLMCSLVRCMRK
jgi:hypothetical protein